MFPIDVRAIELIDEFTRRTQHPIHKYVPGNISGWDQLSFHESTKMWRLVSGGNRSGKSYCNAMEIAWWATGDHPYRTTPPPPVKIWVISVEYSVLLAGIHLHLMHLIPDWKIDRIGANVPNTDLPSYIRLKNGSQITYKSAKGLGDEARRKFQAADIDLISIDEEIDDTILIELEARTLDRGGSFIISATLVESYDWIVELEEKAEANDPNCFATRLNTELNKTLVAERVAILRDKLSEEERDVRIYGKSRRSTGLIYNTFKKEIHVIPKFDIPLDWPRWCALDPGIRVFAGLWITCSPDNIYYVYREMYVTNTPLWEVAEIIKVAEGWKLDRQLAQEFGHYVWEETDTSETMVNRLIDDKRGSRLITGDEGVLDQLYSKFGLVTTPAIKSKRPGIEAVRHALEGHLFFFDHLEKTLWEMKKYRIRDHKTSKNRNEPIDMPIEKDDHLMDCLRYLIIEELKYSDRQVRPEAMQRSGRDWARNRRKKVFVDEFLGSGV